MLKNTFFVNWNMIKQTLAKLRNFSHTALICPKGQIIKLKFSNVTYRATEYKTGA